MIDKAMVIKGLECCTRSEGYTCRECPYQSQGIGHWFLQSCFCVLQKDALELLRTTPEIVYCHHCEHNVRMKEKDFAQCELNGVCYLPDYWCAWGEKRNGEKKE